MATPETAAVAKYRLRKVVLPAGGGSGERGARAARTGPGPEAEAAKDLAAIALAVSQLHDAVADLVDQLNAKDA